MAFKGSRVSVVLLLCLALYPAALARLILVPIDGSTLWRGYYTLVLPGRVGMAGVEARLNGAGFTTISASSALLGFTDFSGDEVVPVADLSQRFVASDPRLDPYMREASALFRSGGDQLIFLRASSGLLLTELRLASALAGLRWRLADADFGRQAAGITLLLLAASVVALLGAKRRRLLLARAVGLLPWIPLAATGLPGLVAPSLLLYGGWALLVERLPTAIDEWSSAGRIETVGLASGFAMTLAAGCALMLLDPARPGFAVVIGEAFTADLALAGLIWYVRLSARRRQKRRHPSRATRAPRPPERLPVGAATAMLALALLVAGTFFLDRIDQRATRLPVPVFVAGLKGWSEAALSRLARASGDRPGADELPDIAGYVEHRAFQEALAYGGTYGFPAPNARIMLPRFRREGRGFAEAPETVVSFGAKWYSGILHQGDGLTPLFRAQLRPSLTLRASPSERLGLSERGWLLFPIALLLLVPALGLGEGLTALLMYGMRSAGSRRKQQAA